MSIVRQNKNALRERKIASLMALLPEGFMTDDGEISTGTTKGTAGINVTEFTDDGCHYLTTLILENVIVGTPTAGGNTSHGVLIYTFPAGIHVHTATYFNIGLTIGSVTTDTPDVGIGSVRDVGAHALLSDCAAGSEDYITGQLWAVALNGAITEVGPVGAVAGMLTGISLNKTSDAKTVYLNVADGWAAGVTGSLRASGTVVLMWTRIV
jgi:hypothetical protein